MAADGGDELHVPAVPYTRRVDFKLGKRPATPDARDLKLATLTDLAALPTPPARFGHATMYHSTGWAMLGNDRYGDCVFAGAAHETMETNRLARRDVTFDDQAVLSDYSALTGFKPADPNTDQGTDVRQALGYRRTTGVIDAHGNRHKIGAYIALDPKDWEQLMQAVYLFAAVGIGFEFPASAMEQFNHHEPWDVVPGSPIEGGHYVPVMGRSSLNVAGIVTWGCRQPMTRAFYEAYNDESFAIVFPEELGRGGLNERGFDLDGLNAALARL